MRDSKQYLDDIHNASIKAYGKKKNPPQLPQIVQMRQHLHLYWEHVANFMQIECYQTTNKVVDLQSAEGAAQLITALKELNDEADKCIIQVNTLIGQHDEFIRFFRAQNIEFHGSNAIISSFTQECGVLRAGLMDLLTLIGQQGQICATYETMARTNYTPAMLKKSIDLGKEWKPHATKAKETYIQLKKLSDEINGSGVNITEKHKECIIT
jgi:hypothetical protein